MTLGKGGGTRTPGARFWRPTLYQLSYTPIKFCRPSGTQTYACSSQSAMPYRLGESPISPKCLIHLFEDIGWK